jgi:hypothetical protein
VKQQRGAGVVEQRVLDRRLNGAPSADRRVRKQRVEAGRRFLLGKAEVASREIDQPLEGVFGLIGCPERKALERVRRKNRLSA